MSHERLDQASQHLLRVRSVIDIASLLGAEAFDDELPDLFEDFLDTPAQAVHASAQGLRDALEKVEKGADFMGVYTGDYCGILMQVGTPVRKYRVPVTDSEICSYSWGHMYLGWVYGETYEAAWEQAIDWAKQRDAENMASALKGVAA